VRADVSFSSFRPCRTHRPLYSSGIGYETTKRLVEHGATVYLACRSKERTEAAIAKLEEEVPSARGKGMLRVLVVDMGDTHAVRRAALEFMQREDRLDVLGGLLALPFRCA
jgi:retinol dehydrogenase-12